MRPLAVDLFGLRWLPLWGLLLGSCAASPMPAPTPAAVAAARQPDDSNPGGASGARSRFRLRLCTAAPIHLDGPPGVQQSRGCVVTFRQRLSDLRAVASLGATEVERRYLVYAPLHLPPHPAPVVLVFPGYSSSAEAVAFYNTHTRFEALADRDGFIVVYGNGLPNPPSPREHVAVPKGGFLSGCLSAHDGEGVDVAYVRQLLDQLATELPIDRTRIYATGLSAGGGMSFELAMEAPDLVAAIAPVVPLPFQPSGAWRMSCHPRPGFDRISIAMVASTDGSFISYEPGSSREYPSARYPGMEQARDAWLAALGLSGPPQIDVLPDLVQGDSYEPATGRSTSTIERQRYRPGPDGRELWYYRAVGMGHTWPSPTQSWEGQWRRFGKTNQDIDFADEAWTFFQRHVQTGTLGGDLEPPATTPLGEAQLRQRVKNAPLPRQLEPPSGATTNLRDPPAQAHK
jgi:polyhydroxybutyrate depolymerase